VRTGQSIAVAGATLISFPFSSFPSLNYRRCYINKEVIISGVQISTLNLVCRKPSPDIKPRTFLDGRYEQIC